MTRVVVFRLQVLAASIFRYTRDEGLSTCIGRGPDRWHARTKMNNAASSDSATPKSHLQSEDSREKGPSRDPFCA